MVGNGGEEEEFGKYRDRVFATFRPCKVLARFDDPGPG